MDSKVVMEGSGSLLAESVPDAKAKRRSSTRRMSFNPRQSLAAPGITCDNPAALRIYKNMRRAMRARFEAAKQELKKAESELSLGSNKLADLYTQVRSLEHALGTEGDVLDEELLLILAESTNRSDEPLEQGPLKKARLENQPPDFMESPLMEIVRRFEEWNTSDGVCEIREQITLDPLEGLHKTANDDPKTSTSTSKAEQPDILTREQAYIQRFQADHANIEAQQRAALVKRRVQRLNALPGHVITVERLAQRLAGTVM